MLEATYGYSRISISKVLETILQIRQFHIEQPEIVWQALRGYQNKGADFADHYLGNINIANRCSSTWTFDKKAARLTTFTLLTNR